MDLILKTFEAPVSIGKGVHLLPPAIGKTQMHKSFPQDTESCNWLMCAHCFQKAVSQTIVKFSFRLCGQYNITLQPPLDKSIFKIKPAELCVLELFYLVLNTCSH
jgi:hypothetical protein